MREYNIKKMLSVDKGITLVALMITVSIMAILLAATVSMGKETINNSRLGGLYFRLEVIQKRVDDIASTNESYVDTNGNITYIMEKGKGYDELSPTQKNILMTECEELDGINPEDFRYFSVYQLEKILGLSDVRYNVFIDFKTRTIIAENGITIDGVTYRVLKSKTHFISQDTSKNEGEISTLKFKLIKYGKEYIDTNNDCTYETEKVKNYKITLIDVEEIGDIKKDGTLKYKKSVNKYWKIAENFEFIIDELTDYDIQYIDVNGNNRQIQIKKDLLGDLINNKFEGIDYIYIYYNKTNIKIERYSGVTLIGTEERTI